MTSANPIFSPLNEYFDHIYVLTLDSAKNRQENIERVLSGLSWSFFKATDKQQLSYDVVTNDGTYDDDLHRQTKRTHRSMNLGEIACTLSHLSMYQDMLDKGYQRVLIFEDDVLPQFETLQHFSDVMAQLPQNWELLMLGYYGHKPPTAFYRIQQRLYRLFHQLKLFNWHHVSKNWINNICMREYSKDIFQIGKVLGAHAYAVNRSAAEKFIAYQTPVHLQADRIFNYYMAEHPLQAFALKQTMFTLSELSKVSSIQTK